MTPTPRLRASTEVRNRVEGRHRGDDHAELHEVLEALRREALGRPDLELGPDFRLSVHAHQVVVLFLAADSARGITGQTRVLDGGGLIEFGKVG